jgi:hypothetical protein
MLPSNPGGHSTYQDHVHSLFLEYYPDPDALSVSTWLTNMCIKVAHFFKNYFF